MHTAPLEWGLKAPEQESGWLHGSKVRMAKNGEQKRLQKPTKKACQDNQVISPTVAAKPLETLIFAIFFERLDENPRNFRSEHLRTSPTGVGKSQSGGAR